MTKLKWTVQHALGPVLRRLRPVPPAVDIKSHLLVLAPDVAERMLAVAPVATNAAGRRAWVLSREEYTALHERWKTNILIRSGTGIRTGTGAQARLFSSDSGSPGKIVTTGTRVGVEADFVTGEIRMKLAVEVTESTAAMDKSNPVATNLVAMCQALVPSEGALLLEGANQTAPNTMRYWMLLLPTAVDAKGNLIKR